jgi:hypothetical protein
MDEVVMAKCPACGTVAEGTKAAFLETMPCCSCQANVLFVFLMPASGAGAEE